MRLVNLTTRTAYTTMSGTLGPGEKSSDGGPYRSRLEKAMQEVVSACGNRLGVVLNEKEADLLERIVSLDEKGRNFDRASLPKEILDDPDGMKKAERMEDEAQKSQMDAIAEANAKASRTEAEIKGETGGMKRTPEGPAVMKGEKVGPSDLKSGFEKIMEENARLDAGKAPSGANFVNEAIDPIGSHMKKDADEAPEAKPERTDGAYGKDAELPKQASGLDDDATRNADAKAPAAKAQDPRNSMDVQAAKMAEGLSVLSAISNPPPQKGKKGRPKGKKSE